MPLCDAYIPLGALEPDAERKLVADVTHILVEHEIRRIAELKPDAEFVEAMRKQARSIAWTFVHRTETYVDGVPITAPFYRFVASVPEGQIDEQFVPAINRDILAAVVEAERGKYPHPERRLWVFALEVPDGTWGAGGRVLHLEQIIDYVSPGWGAYADERFDADKQAAAAALVALANAAPAAV